MWTLQYHEKTRDNLIWTDQWVETWALLKILDYFIYFCV